MPRKGVKRNNRAGIGGRHVLTFLLGMVFMLHR